MRIKHRGRRKKPEWGRILALAAMIGAVIAVDAGIRPMVREAAAGQTQIVVNRIIQQAVLTVLEEDGLRYQSFVTLRQNQNGETTALTTDAVLINRLQGELLEKILQTLQETKQMTLKLPLGSLSGNQFLAGRGPMVTLHLRPVGMVKTKIINQFDEAGINQTRHRIQLQVTVDMLSLLPGYRISSQAQSNVILAETIIVGLIPDAYTEVYGGTDDLVGMIQDYGALGG